MSPSSLCQDFNPKWSSPFPVFRSFYSTGSGSPLPINMLKPHSFCKQPSVSLSSPQASIPPLDFPSEDSSLYSLPLSYNSQPLSCFPCPITLLVTEGSKHVQLVKCIPGPLSRLQLEFSVRESFLKIDLFAELVYPLHILYASDQCSPTYLPITIFQWLLIGYIVLKSHLGNLLKCILLVFTLNNLWYLFSVSLRDCIFNKHSGGFQYHSPQMTLSETLNGNHSWLLMMQTLKSGYLWVEYRLFQSQPCVLARGLSLCALVSSSDV